MTRPIALYDDHGDPVPLGERLFDSGEAALYTHDNDPTLIAKVHHAPDAVQREKLAALPSLAPVDPSLDSQHRNFAWPISTLRNAGDDPVGVIIPAVRGARSLVALGNPKLRARRAAEFNWHFLHAVAANIAFLFERLHDQGIVIGDVKPENVLVNDRALVTLIDCDSVQVAGHLCPVGSEGFTAPEWIDRRFTDAPRSPEADLFGLAVLLYQLLTGAHPWTGEWMGGGDPPPRDTLIRSGDWPYRAGARLRPVPGMVPPDSLSPHLEELFRRAFIAGIKDPSVRPSASDWHQASCLALAELEPCQAKSHHHHDVSLDACPWCARVDAGLPDLFPAPSSPGDPFGPLVLAFERALARGDTRMAVDLWRGNPILAKTPDLARLEPRMQTLCTAMDAVDMLETHQGDPSRLLGLAEDYPILLDSTLFQHEEINGHTISEILAMAPEQALTIPPTPSTELKVPRLAPARRKPALPSPTASIQDILEIRYRLQAGWLGLRPAELVLLLSKPAKCPGLILCDEQGQVLASLPSQRLQRETRFTFEQPTGRVLLKLHPAAQTDLVSIKHPSPKSRTLGSKTRAPMLTPLSRQSL